MLQMLQVFVQLKLTITYNNLCFQFAMFSWTISEQNLVFTDFSWNSFFVILDWRFPDYSFIEFVFSSSEEPNKNKGRGMSYQNIFF